jgi:AraC-like DNA-binding protein
MQLFTNGKYLGSNKKEINVGGVLLSQTIYEEGLNSDWHYHENPYFAFVLNGGSVEQRKKESIDCIPGLALFYNWEELHRNTKYQSFSKNFNIEFDRHWLSEMDINVSLFSGSFTIRDPDLIFSICNVLKEYTVIDPVSQLSIQTTALQLLDGLNSETSYSKLPEWLETLEEFLNDRWAENFSLYELSVLLNVHPVTISRYFPRFFKCTIGEYIRKLRISRSLNLIRQTKMSLTEIAFECNFSDQSHFTRTFKNFTGFLPKHFKKL